MNYQQLKRLAKNTQRSVTNLLALSPKNDPFYVGTPSDILNAEWFLNLWTSFNYESGIHLRRMHYQIISQAEPVKMPNGNPYENTNLCWGFLVEASKSARYLELVDPTKFVDRRNPSPVGNIEKEINPIAFDVEYFSLFQFTLPELPEPPEYEAVDIHVPQRYHLELWCEKSSMNDILKPLCVEYAAILQTGLGEMSITAVLGLLERIRKVQKPTRIFYISDFDPAGMSMPIATSRKLEYFLTKHLPTADVRLYPIVLTADQVAQYRLPRTPIKETERRGAKFEERNGEGAVELDALESLYPGELRNIVSNHLENYYDRTLDRRTRELSRTLNRELGDRRQAVILNHALELDKLKSDYKKFQEEIAGRMEELNQQARELYDRIADDLQEFAPDPAEVVLPHALDVEELSDPLFDTERDYLDQIRAYKNFQKESPTTLSIQGDLFAA